MKLPILLLVISTTLTPAAVGGQPSEKNGEVLSSQARCDSTDAVKIKLKLFTKSYSTEGKIISPEDPNLLKLAGFEPSLKTIIVIHGWLSNSLPTLSGFRLKNVIFSHSASGGEYFNVILVDWSDIDTILYWVAADKVPVVGSQTARVMRLIADTFKYDLSNFHIIGHSLGAHIAGTTVRFLNSTEPIITGLDPAGPLFLAGNPLRLNSTVSRNVIIIYTCGNYLSISDGVGHTNVYPSGGNWPQPGCSWDLGGVCSHCRSYVILVEMILNTGIQLTKCENFQEFKNGNCKNNAAQSLNFLFPAVSPRGNFYFMSNPSLPYCPSATVSVDRDWDKTVARVGC